MLTSQDLTGQVLPYVRNALHLAKNDIRADLKRWEWAVLYPAWSIITGPLLPLLTRLTLELSFALTRKHAVPILSGIVTVMDNMEEQYVPQATKKALHEFRDLYAGGQVHPAVADTVAGKHCGEADCLAGVQ